MSARLHAAARARRGRVARAVALRAALASCVPALACAQARGAASPTGAPALARVADSLAAAGFSGTILLGTATSAGRPGVAADDRVLLERAMGWRDPFRREPLRVTDAWRWASVTKQVTAALVMREVDAGRLALDAPVGTYLPDFRGANGARITIRQLLQHTSGLPDPDEGPADADGMPRYYRAGGAGAGDRAATAGACAAPSRREPGAEFRYQNCDYLVLGAVLARVTGVPYATLVRDLLARPLGLRTLHVAGDATVRAGVRDTAAASRPALVAQLRALARARGETVLATEPAGDARTPERPFVLATYGAAAALVGTPRELLAFDRALLRHTLVSPAGTTAMWTGTPAYGFAALGAWSFPATLAGCAAPVQLVERRGAIGGVQVRNVIAPALGRMLVVFTNDGAVDFGEAWQGRGLAFTLFSAAFCA